MLALALAGCGNPELPPREGAPAAAAPADVGETLANADAALRRGEMREAMQGYGKVLGADGTNARARIGTAEVHLATGAHQKALEQFDSVLKAADDPKAEPAPRAAAEAERARALQGRGIALLLLRRKLEAVPPLEQAVELDPRLGRAWNALGQLRDSVRDWAGAERAYAQALAAMPGSAMVLNNSGVSLMLQGRHAAAEALFQQALAIEPGLAAAEGNLRLALASQGRYGDALAGVGKPQMPAALNNMGYVAMMRGDWDAAEGYLARALELSPAYHGTAADNMVRLKAVQPEGTVRK